MKSFPSSLLLSLRIDRDNLDLGVFMSHSFQQYLHSVTVFHGLPKPTENNILNFLTVLFYFTMHTLTSQFLFFFFLTQLVKFAKTYVSLDRWTELHLLLEMMEQGFIFLVNCGNCCGNIQKTELLERQQCEAPPTLLRIRD